MKKHALAVVIGAVMAIPGTALADGPKLYGKWNVTLQQSEETLGLGAVDPVTGADLNGKVLDYDGNGSRDEWEVKSNASRIGIKGDADLDVGDLKATYQFEWEIDSLDEGSAAAGNTFKTRNSFVGLKHKNAGHFFIGAYDSPLKKAQGKVDQFNDTDADIKGQIDAENRFRNSINWHSPSWGGVSLAVQVMPGESRPELDNDLVYAAPKDQEGLADGKSASITYKANNFWVAAAMDKDAERDGVSTNRVAAQFTVDMFELGALVQSRTEEVSQAASLAGAEDRETDSVVVSAAVKPTDRLKLKVQHVKSDDKFGAANNILLAGTGDDKREWTSNTFGADYKLGKNTKVYAFISRQKVDGKQNSLNPLSEDKTRNNFSAVGLEHKF